MLDVAVGNAMSMNGKRRKVGRPPKFQEPRCRITVTLPERVMQLLAAVDPDRSKAISKVVGVALAPDRRNRLGVDMVEVSPGKALIIVPFNRFLDRLTMVRLVEIAPGRHLISIPSGTSVEVLELAIGDIAEDATDATKDERDVLDMLRTCVKASRRKGVITKEEILFVETSGLKD